MCEDCVEVKLAPEGFTEEQVKQQKELATEISRLIEAYQKDSGVEVGMLVVINHPKGWQVEVLSREELVQG